MTTRVQDHIDLSKAKPLGRGLKTGRRFTLRTLRIALGKTQEDVAETAQMAQGDVSKLEGREDIKLSTLMRYAAALGGGLEVSVKVGGRRYVIDISEHSQK